MFRKRKILWYIDGTYVYNILSGQILKSIFHPNVMISYHSYAGNVLFVGLGLGLGQCECTIIFVKQVCLALIFL